MATLPSNGGFAFGAVNGSNNLVNGDVARLEAQQFLESVKPLKEGPSYGFTLASNKAQSPFARYYGLSLLEYAITHNWSEYGDEEAACLRGWVLELAQRVSRGPEDLLYIRNKIAQLWVEVAKRSWGAEWMDMDAMLVELWHLPGFTVHKELVLSVLGSLSEEIIGGDDPIVAMRENVLDKAVVDIFMPAPVITAEFPSREQGAPVRCGDEGWLQRAVVLLGECLGSNLQSEDVRTCALKALSMLTVILPWAFPKAVIETNCVRYMYEGLVASHVAVQKASLEALHALYARSGFSDEHFLALIAPMYDKECVERFSQLFAWSTVDAEDIDDDKYLFAKKFSETISHLGNYLDRKFHVFPPGADIQPFLHFLLQVVQSQSLVVSIPILVTWTRMLNNRSLGPSIAKSSLVASLLEVCSSRLVRYENLPEDTQDPTLLLLMEDTDTIPERHAFLGNYRRYSSQIIESIVELTLSDAINHILGQTENVLQHLYDGHPPMNPAAYTKNSMPYLRVDAQFTVIESALKGYVRSRPPKGVSQDQIDMQRAQLDEHLEAWCNRLIEMKFEDPLIRKRVLQLLVAFSTTALRKNNDFMLKVLEHILMTWPAAQPEYRHLNEAIKDLQAESINELQRLAFKMPDNLLAVYDSLDNKIQEMSASGTLDERRLVNYKSFLFIIIHRATNIDPTTRLQRLQMFVEPVKSQWRDDGLKRALESYQGFCEMIGLDKAQRYLASRGVDKIADWGAVELDAEGSTLQAELEERQQMLPLRATKTFLNYSVDKLDKSTAPYQASCALWQDSFPVILPRLLEFLAHAHASANPRNWAFLPAEMQSIVGRVLTDRFWQAGISEGSKDDFYSRVINKKNTLEGLASSIRGSIRYVREFCYSIIFCMSCLEQQFYGVADLPDPLARALFTDCHYLSSHQLIALLNLVRLLIDVCPVELRHQFLPSILEACFRQTDGKIKSEWDKLDQALEIQAAADALTEEMKAESVLRQLSYSAVIMVADFLDPQRIDQPLKGTAQRDDVDATPQYPSLRKFCLMHSSIIEPLLVFMTHAIRMHDSRCCGVVLKVFRSIIPELPPVEPAKHAPPPDDFMIPEETSKAVREFMCGEVLQACISSLHEHHFVDLQRELGNVLAAIIANYGQLTATPRMILSSLPNMRQEDVDQCLANITRTGTNQRQQRAYILDLLKDLKGVSIAEMGKVDKTSDFTNAKKKASTRSQMQQEFMTAPSTNGQEERGKSPDLTGVAGLFDG
ncbi:hypothetical protein M406DRAFT_65109 [Cryphonectria parasitica EP155]|uniref:Exportin-5 C-terminal domain-containing protein n=1 Tax=Cryphonectria parasitica (strain ATCC 38755 / EP155) TaxID=660469 RepID=A0A9P4XZR7_CRYP1|nr:uncharacterized protein M406DRAFT_65109 [Cryphonectria parasitica EP155]KAF3763765.1 hypothetical protein M406DRAFT_65109 [Cryphonectria parasitica EP155]